MEMRPMAAASQNTPNVHTKCCHGVHGWRGNSPGGNSPVSQVQKRWVARGSVARVLRIVSGFMAFSVCMEPIKSAARCRAKQTHFNPVRESSHG
jgi:hypothetical protein